MTGLSNTGTGMRSERRLRELANLRELLKAHLQPEAGPHSMEVAVATGLRAVEIAEEALRDR